LPIFSLKKNCNSNASTVKSRKKAPVEVLFCGALQIFNSPGIDYPRRVWYLTTTFISKREINRFVTLRQLNRFNDLVQVSLSRHND
jgi:hypothetical protein